MLRVDPKTVTRWARGGKLSSIRTPGGHRRYSENEVRGFLNGWQQHVSLPRATDQWSAGRLPHHAGAGARHDWHTRERARAFRAPDRGEIGREAGRGRGEMSVGGV